MLFTAALMCACSLDVEVPNTQGPATVQPRGSTLTGLVLDDHGAPLAGVRVALDRFGADDGDFGPFALDPSTQRHTITDAQGRYSFDGLEWRTAWTLIAQHAEFAPRMELAVPVGCSGTYDQPPLNLARGFSIAGFAHDERGHPVANARIELQVNPWSHDTPAEFGAQTLSDANGVFSFEHVANQSETISATASDRRSAPVWIANPTGADSITVDVELRQARHVSGVVCDDRGTPLRDVFVESSLGGGAWTNAEGAFRIEGSEPGPIRLQVRTPKTEDVVDLGIERDRDDVVLVSTGLRATHVVVEMTYAADGDPPRAVEVLLHEASTEPGRSNIDAGRELGLHPARMRSIEFDVPIVAHSVPPGFLDARAPSIELRAEGRASLFFQVPRDATATGAFEQRVTWTSGGSLLGRVVDTNGAPVAGARVHAREREWITDDPHPSCLSCPVSTTRATRADAVTSDDGSFRLDHLVESAYLLLIDGPGFVRQDLECEVVDGRATEVAVLPMLRGATLRGRVVGRDGTPRPLARVRIAEESGPFGRQGYQRVDTNGAFEFTGVAPGEVELEAATLDARPFSAMASASNESKRRLTVTDGATEAEIVLVQDDGR